MRFILSLCLFASLLLPSVLEAEGPLEPSLGVAFPVKEDNGNLVLTSTLLMNMNDILPAGTVLHNIFLKPKKDDKDVKARKNKDFNSDNYAAIQRNKIENREIDPNKTAVMKATEDRAGGDAMSSELKFRAALHRMLTEEYYIAYDLPGSTERRIGQFEYPEGLFLGEVGGKVVIFAVQADSVPANQGVAAGAYLTALNGIPLKSLADFRDRYFKEKEKRQLEGKAVTMTFIAAGQSESKDVVFKVKRSLGNEADLMSDMSGDMSKKKGPAEEPVKDGEVKKKAAPVEEQMTVPLIP